MFSLSSALVIPCVGAGGVVLIFFTRKIVLRADVVRDVKIKYNSTQKKQLITRTRTRATDVLQC